MRRRVRKDSRTARNPTILSESAEKSSCVSKSCYLVSASEISRVYMLFQAIVGILQQLMPTASDETEPSHDLNCLATSGGKAAAKPAARSCGVPGPHPMHRHRNRADMLLLSPQSGSPHTEPARVPTSASHQACSFASRSSRNASSLVGQFETLRRRLVFLKTSSKRLLLRLPGRNQIRQRGVSNILEFGDDLVELVEPLLDLSLLG